MDTPEQSLENGLGGAISLTNGFQTGDQRASFAEGRVGSASGMDLSRLPAPNALVGSQHETLFKMCRTIRYGKKVKCTLSASGRWASHISRAHFILDECGGPPALTSQRSRSQVAMMIWWDATLALVSRQGPILPRPYLDHLRSHETDDQWSFYQLSGCPTELVVHISSLAELAQQKELASSMTWLAFDLTPVLHIEAQICSWKNPSSCSYFATDFELNHTAGTDEDTLHARKDRYHCIEAWRHALLLYIERVFKWDRGVSQPKTMGRLIRSTLDHVRCCRRTSMTQKQLLLPVFLAGSETRDEEMRSVVRRYCRWWGQRSRYHMFHSVPSLLEEIWAAESWWGDVVDSKTRGTSGQTPVQYLLG
ncbi:uncharacterized protein ATNIH1004_000103 [Aspergillus tanneri]|uniref:Uncharacterized protein n=1 Tax=Aspergillus tanneri TaxID=1220188 RepID=A0A5M9MVV9_9EURO|nr:uncharacterized protein ATNIH1004_000103 [Aspergillus tanneri]KAA8651225.1 hypothetical protein ATNIH1004_000103 [Aspergillus tanneri]